MNNVGPGEGGEVLWGMMNNVGPGVGGEVLWEITNNVGPGVGAYALISLYVFPFYSLYSIVDKIFYILPFSVGKDWMIS